MATLTNSQILEVYKSAEMAVNKYGARFGRKISADDNADLCQATAMKVIETFNPDKGTPGALAYLVAGNLAIDFLRGRSHAGGSKESHIGDMGSDDDEGHSSEYDAPDTAPNALDIMLANERSGKVARALGTLKPHQRAALSADLADERNLTGAERKAKHDAIKALSAKVA